MMVGPSSLEVTGFVKAAGVLPNSDVIGSAADLFRQAQLIGRTATLSIVPVIRVELALPEKSFSDSFSVQPLCPLCLCG